MKNSWRRNVLALGGVATASLLAGMLISSRLDWTTPTEAVPPQEGKAEKAAVVGPGSSLFVEIAKRDTPAVVNISTTTIVRQRRPDRRRRRPTPFEEFFGQDEFFDRFFGEMPERDLKQQSLGSGFIVDEEGYILTNNHVVENADDIKVTLADGRSYQAEVKGADPKTDIALIKIDAENNLPVAVLGDSENLEVGEWVMAIGNPFGLKHTVTVGVVSAKGRTIGTGPYDDFIQTDASINPGNSGGPLINMKGEVVGINTAIIGQGIGFAIPVNLARDIMGQLRDKGVVTRGWLGVQIQAITPELAESLGLSGTTGALIAGVFKGDPADEAGIKPGDVIVRFDGKDVASDRDLVALVGSTLVGKKVKAEVLRGEKKISVEIEVAKRQDGEEEADAGDSGSLKPHKLGISVQNLTEELAERLRLDSTSGILVTAVESGSAADRAGIIRGDVIVEVNRRAVSNLKDFGAAVKRAGKSGSFLLLVKRGNGNLFIVVKPEKD
jgi:serine protease Do